jgi:hypothetical protein
MSIAPLPAARTAHRYFVRREYGACLERAFLAMRFADETSRRISPAKVRRAVDGLIDGARRPMMFADGLRARRAACHFVDADVLGPSTFAFRHALSAETTLSVRRRHGSERRVLLADLAAADCATDDARATCQVPALRARRLVRGAVRLLARDAGPRVLGARWMTVHVTRRDAVIPTEILGAHAARQRARIARDVSRLADGEPSDGRRAALRAGKSPVAGAVEPALGEEWRANTVAVDELPLCALHEQSTFRELHRVHDRAHLMPALLLATSPRVLGLDRALIRRLAGGAT